MEFNFRSKPNRRFLARLGISATVALLSSIAAKSLIGQGLVDGPLRWALALIPGLAMAGIFYAYGMLIIEQKDEFIRMLILRALVIATGIGLGFPRTLWARRTHLSPLFRARLAGRVCLRWSLE